MKILAVAAVSASLCLTMSLARATTVSSTVSEDNGATNSAGDGNQALYDVPANHPAVVTTAGGYDFSASYLTIGNIGQITFTMSAEDGDTGAGNFDFNHVTLYLGAPSDYDTTTGILTGGVNTGIVLNGFRGNGLLDTQTFTMSLSPTVGAALLTELTNGSGHLSAFMVSNNTSDTVAAPNEVYVGNDSADATTTLVLNTVPEPQTYALAGLGMLFLAAAMLRRKVRSS